MSSLSRTRMLVFLLFLSSLVFALQAEPSGEIELRAQVCAATINEAGSASYSSVCDGIYPGACSAGNDLVSCDDGLIESQTSSQNNRFSGIRIETYNTTITNCGSIVDVQLCYEWWVDLTNVAECLIAVDADGGSDYTTIISTCPGTSANPGVTCVNVTTPEIWTCNSFFDATGVRALVRNQIRSTSAADVQLSTEVFFFNVTYTTTAADTEAPNVTLIAPLNNNITSTGNVTFTSNATENIELLNATLYHNLTGVWQANESVNISGVENATSFTINNLPDTSFIWNVEYCDTSDNCAFATNNFTVTVELPGAPDTTPPTVNLTDPLDGNVTSTGNVTFTSNATENIGFLNATLYHNLTGVWQANETVNVSGLENATSFILFSIPNTFFIWNVEYCDTSSNCAFASSNFTLTVNLSSPPSTTPPNVTLLSPADASLFTVDSVTLRATVYDNDLDSLTVWFYGDGPLINTITTVTNGSTVSYIWTGLSNGLHVWYVTVGDGTTNVSSVIRNFTVATPPGDSGPGSGSKKSGGGGSGLKAIQRSPGSEAVTKERYQGPSKTPAPSPTPPSSDATVKTVTPPPTPPPITGGAIGTAITTVSNNIGKLLLGLAFLAGALSFVLRKKQVRKTHPLNRRSIRQKIMTKGPDTLYKLEGLISKEFLEKIRRKEEKPEKPITSKEFKRYFPETVKELKAKGIKQEELHPPRKTDLLHMQKIIQREKKVTSYPELQKIFPETIGKAKVKQYEKSIVLEPVRHVSKKVAHHPPIKQRSTFTPIQKPTKHVTHHAPQANRKINKKTGKQDMLRGLQEVYDIE